MEDTPIEKQQQHQQQQQPSDPANSRCFSFLPLNDRDEKPRSRGITEIRGPYYSFLGVSRLGDLLSCVGRYVDHLKWSGGSFALMPGERVRAMNQLAHRHGVQVSTGGFIERVLSFSGSGSGSGDLVDRYLRECAELRFDIVELSSGFITLPTDDWARLVDAVHDAGLKAKPELGIQFGAGGGSTVAELEGEGSSSRRSVRRLVARGRRFLERGAFRLMIESEGITESVRTWRTDVVARIVDELGMRRVMFEAADPRVFSWYVQSFGPDVNLFVDHSRIVQLECLRSGLWGTKSLWGRVAAYKPHKGRKKEQEQRRQQSSISTS